MFPLDKATKLCPTFLLSSAIIACGNLPGAVSRAPERNGIYPIPAPSSGERASTTSRPLLSRTNTSSPRDRSTEPWNNFPAVSEIQHQPPPPAHQRRAGQPNDSVQLPVPRNPTVAKSPGLNPCLPSWQRFNQATGPLTPQAPARVIVHVLTRRHPQRRGLP